MIRKNHGFLIVDEHAKAVGEVSFWYKANYRIIGVLATPTGTVNRIIICSLGEEPVKITKEAYRDKF